jgi:hypothetical protein
MSRPGDPSRAPTRHARPRASGERRPAWLRTGSDRGLGWLHRLGYSGEQPPRVVDEVPEMCDIEVGRLLPIAQDEAKLAQMATGEDEMVAVIEGLVSDGIAPAAGWAGMTPTEQRRLVATLLRTP